MITFRARSVTELADIAVVLVDRGFHVTPIVIPSDEWPCYFHTNASGHDILDAVRVAKKVIRALDVASD